ncbi:hypothetical protein GCM10009725_11710 [Aeromicrobium tamlense]
MTATPSRISARVVNRVPEPPDDATGAACGRAVVRGVDRPSRRPVGRRDDGDDPRPAMAQANRGKAPAPA